MGQSLIHPSDFSLIFRLVWRKKPTLYKPFVGVPAMKRLIALASPLLAASACATTTNTNEGANTNVNANANARPAATATPAGGSPADLEAKEHQVCDAIKAKNYDAFAALLSDDFTFVTSNGIHNKQDTVNMLKGYELTDYSFSDIRRSEERRAGEE